MIWNEITGKIVARLSGHRGTVNAVSWHPNRPQIVSVSDDKSIKVWSDLHRSAVPPR